MVITIEELYAMKDKAVEELRSAQAKISVVDELIKLAEAKELPKSEEEQIEYTTEPVEYTAEV